MNRKYGWIPDLPDHRDFTYKAIAPCLVELPEKIDLRSDCSPIENQGSLGSCTANACAGNIEYLQRKGVDPVPDNPVTPKMTWWQRILSWFGLYKPLTFLRSGQYKDTSRLYIYYNARTLIGTAGQDSGAYLRDCMKTLASEGHCLESLWPYDISKYTVRPSSGCYENGHLHCITSYNRLTTLNDMKTCLAEGFPFVFGITLYESFENNEVARTGVVPMPGPSESVIGGHAVMAVGYDDSTKRFLVRNSWGNGWGQGGYFTIPYEYLTSLGDDFWTIRKGNGHVA